MNMSKNSDELFGHSAVMLTRKKPVSWSFGKESRFRERKKTIDAAFVSMPSTLSPRSTVLGFGTRWTPQNERGKDSPPPDTYYIPTTFGTRGPKLVKESSLPPLTSIKFTTPGPGTYECPSPIGKEAPKYTFHGTNFRKKSNESPAPGFYSPKSAYLEFSGFKHISFGVGERILFRKKSIDVPGPGSYEISRGIGRRLQR